MLAKDIDFTKITDHSYDSVVLGRRTARYLDPNHVVSREEILQIIREALSFTPSAVNSQPYRFLVVDTDASKQKLDDVMLRFDKDRIKSASFAIVPLADRNWYETYDELLEQNKKIAPEKYTDDFINALLPEVYRWVEELTADGGRYLDRSISLQTGLITMSILIALRSHGLDAGVMDDWRPDMLAEKFGIDTERYVPQCAIGCGKSNGPVFDNFRFEAEDLVIFGE